MIVGLFSNTVKVSAENQQGTCTITDRIGGGNTTRTYTATETESECNSRSRYRPVSLSWSGCTFTSPRNGTTISSPNTNETSCKNLPGGTFKLHLMLPTNTITVSTATTSATTHNWYYEYRSNLLNKEVMKGSYFTEANCKAAWTSDLGPITKPCFQSNTPPTSNNTPTPAPANTIYELLTPLPCESGDAGCVGGQLKTFDTTGGLSKYLNLMIKIFIGICAVLAVVMIVMGGLEYMTSELVHSKEAGKDRIMHAILGLLIALGAFALLNTINPDLLISEPKIPEVGVKINTAVSGLTTGGFQGPCQAGTHNNGTACVAN